MTLCSPNSSFPEMGFSVPIISRSKVDFPQPFGPAYKNSEPGQAGCHHNLIRDSALQSELYMIKGLLLLKFQTACNFIRCPNCTIDDCHTLIFCRMASEATTWIPFSGLINGRVCVNFHPYISGVGLPGITASPIIATLSPFSISSCAFLKRVRSW